MLRRLFCAFVLHQPVVEVQIKRENEDETWYSYRCYRLCCKYPGDIGWFPLLWRKMYGRVWRGS